MLKTLGKAYTVMPNNVKSPAVPEISRNNITKKVVGKDLKLNV